MQKTILVTGGAGYIGSHAVLELLASDYKVIVVDNLVNSSQESLRRVEKISQKKCDFFQLDIRDENALEKVFSKNLPVESVIHFAGLKAVGESSQIPIEYYDNNVFGTLSLCKVMQKVKCKNLVFSSSATVYGDPHIVPIKENFPTQATNPYGRTKLFIEEMLKDLQISDPEWNITLLRYFNPVGAHESGLIGEDPRGIPNNLLPYITQVAVGKLEQLSIFGNDYPTKDGTGVRDYIHVVDLAKAHIAAVESRTRRGVHTYNLGTGQGYSVLEMVQAFESISGQKINYQVVRRRPGDIAECWADPSFAEQVLNWKAEKNLHQMLRDSWCWQKNNPQGYA